MPACNSGQLCACNAGDGGCTCLDRAGPGQPCVNTPCADGLDCVPAPPPIFSDGGFIDAGVATCAAPPTTGSPCVGRCGGEAQCQFGPDGGICVAPMIGGAGAPCNSQNQLCDFGTSCTNGSCAALGGSGAACRPTGGPACQPGLACQTPDGGASTCGMLLGENQGPCQDGECANNLLCIDLGFFMGGAPMGTACHTLATVKQALDGFLMMCL
jgi:hypothetical protein